jgi:hypothetical protein
MLSFLEERGAKTSTTCGPSNIEFVQSLSADDVIDYNRKDFMASLDRYSGRHCRHRALLRTARKFVEQ